MILTVTPNTGLDRVYFLDELVRNGRNQAREWVECMGGKGCDAALVLRELGVECVATGLAAGDAGRRMDSILRRAGVTSDFVWTDGETRVNIVLVESRTGAHTTLCAAGIEPDPDAMTGLGAWIRRWAGDAEAVIVAGSLPETRPADEYRSLVEAASCAGAPVIVDAAGEALRHALAVGVAAIKPNRHEAEALCGSITGFDDAIRAADTLRRMGAQWCLLSLGADGAILATDEGSWHSPGVEVEVVNPAGAGDGMTACLALGRARGWAPETVLRHAVAVSAAIVTTRGTAEVHAGDVDRLLPRVVVRRLEGRS